MLVVTQLNHQNYPPRSKMWTAKPLKFRQRLRQEQNNTVGKKWEGSDPTYERGILLDIYYFYRDCIKIMSFQNNASPDGNTLSFLTSFYWRFSLSMASKRKVLKSECPLLFSFGQFLFCNKTRKVEIAGLSQKSSFTAAVNIQKKKIHVPTPKQ